MSRAGYRTVADDFAGLHMCSVPHCRMTEPPSRLATAVSDRYRVEHELGEHFVMFEANPAAAPELRVIRNWAAELKARASR